MELASEYCPGDDGDLETTAQPDWGVVWLTTLTKVVRVMTDKEKVDRNIITAMTIAYCAEWCSFFSPEF